MRTCNSATQMHPMQQPRIMFTLCCSVNEVLAADSMGCNSLFGVLSTSAAHLLWMPPSIWAVTGVLDC